MRSHWESRACAAARVLGGVLLLSIGTIFILINLGFIQSRLIQTWWPLLLIAVGVVKLVGLRRWYRPRKPYTDFA
jgi:membrane protein implicated in regulation of membrane protease activity